MKKQSQNKLSAAQYWEWRTTIEEMQHSESKLKYTRLMHSLMDKDIEIQKLKSYIFKEQVKLHEQKHADSKKEYDKLKERLEKELGRSLNNTIIDDVTFEVKDIE